MIGYKFDQKSITKKVRYKGDLVCFMIGYNPPNYRGSSDIKGAVQNFEDTHTDWNFIWIALFLQKKNM